MSGEPLQERVAGELGWTDIAPAKLLPSLLVGRPPGDELRTPVPDYEHDMGAAWECVEALKADGYELMLRLPVEGGATFEAWDCSTRTAEWMSGDVWALHRETAEEAICEVFLRVRDAEAKQHKAAPAPQGGETEAR